MQKQDVVVVQNKNNFDAIDFNSEISKSQKKKSAVEIKENLKHMAN